MSSSIRAITYEDGLAVTPSDSVNDPGAPFAGFYSGAGGTVVVWTLRNRNITLTNVPAGVIVPLAIMRVGVTGTTATSVIGVYSNPYQGPGPKQG